MENYTGFSYTHDYNQEFSYNYQLYYDEIYRRWDELSSDLSLKYSGGYRKFLIDRINFLKSCLYILAEFYDEYEIEKWFLAIIEGKSVTPIIGSIAKEDELSIRELVRNKEWDSLRPYAKRIFRAKIRNKTLAKIAAVYDFLIFFLNKHTNQWFIYMKTFSCLDNFGLWSEDLLLVTHLHPYPTLAEKSNPAEDKNSGDPKVEGSSWQKGIAMRVLLKMLNASDSDNASAVARLIAFFGGGSVHKLRLSLNETEEEKKRNRQTRITDRQRVLKLFEDIGLEMAVSLVKEEIEKLK